MWLISSVLGYLAFCLLMLLLRPFDAVNLLADERGGDGDPLNQIGFLVAGIVTLFGLSTLVNRRLLGTFLTPTWLSVGIILLISVAVSSEPSTAARRPNLAVDVYRNHWLAAYRAVSDNVRWWPSSNTVEFLRVV